MQAGFIRDLVGVLVVSALVFCLAALSVPVIVVYAGHPAPRPYCKVPGHEGPYCTMKDGCAGMTPDGQKTGKNCTKFCAKDCCGCADGCPREQNQPSEESLRWLGPGD